MTNAIGFADQDPNPTAATQVVRPENLAHVSADLDRGVVAQAVSADEADAVFGDRCSTISGRADAGPSIKYYRKVIQANSARVRMYKTS